MHANESAGDAYTNEFILAMLRFMNIRSFLDVGSATGRGLPEFASGMPGALICGIEPVAGLLRQAIDAGVQGSAALVNGKGELLPFMDESFDAVSEISMLHHVPNPNAVVREMMRVARKMIVISDCNRFGQGSLPARWLKLILYNLRLWKAFDYVRTGGKRYQISEGDGLFYSYSVFDSFDLLAEWAEHVMFLPIGERKSTSWLHPLLTSEAIMLIAFRKAVP